MAKSFDELDQTEHKLWFDAAKMRLFPGEDSLTQRKWDQAMVLARELYDDAMTTPHTGKSE